MTKNANKKMAIAKGGREVNEKEEKGIFKIYERKGFHGILFLLAICSTHSLPWHAGKMIYGVQFFFLQRVKIKNHFRTYWDFFLSKRRWLLKNIFFCCPITFQFRFKTFYWYPFLLVILCFVKWVKVQHKIAIFSSLKLN